WRAETVRDGTVHATLVSLDRQRRTGEPAPRRRIAPPDRRAGCRRLARHAVPVSRRFRLCPAPGEGTLQSAHPAKWSGGLRSVRQGARRSQDDRRGPELAARRASALPADHAPRAVSQGKQVLHAEGRDAGRTGPPGAALEDGREPVALFPATILPQRPVALRLGGLHPGGDRRSLRLSHRSQALGTRGHCARTTGGAEGSARLLRRVTPSAWHTAGRAGPC